MSDVFPRDQRTRVAVITGGHAFEVPPFHALFRAMPDVDAYIQGLDDFTFDCAGVAERYDVVLFYNMHPIKRGDETGPWPFRKVWPGLEALGRPGQGLFVLHHALFAFPDEPLWDTVVGMADRSITSYHHDQSVTTHIADDEHPITFGMSDWTMVDETYVMADASPEDGNHILLTTDHEKCMTTLAWTRQFRDSRVFCYQAGHDHASYEEPNFRKVIHNGIRWCAEQI
jgi:hypothetical protein